MDLRRRRAMSKVSDARFGASSKMTSCANDRARPASRGSNSGATINVLTAYAARSPDCRFATLLLGRSAQVEAGLIRSMCGIAGIFAYHYAANPVERSELRTIRDHMAARGPDGAGEWYAQEERVGLGHRRLSIIDLSERGAQPMTSGDGKCVITFDGEIYNYRELRAVLELKGRKFRTETDTEVILQLYAEKGEAMLEDLRGMFAFALWDAERNALLLARDPYGIKPLYYADDGWTLRFASQVKALLAGGRVSRDPEPAGWAGFCLFGSVPEPFTT
jgi:asparagine synthase (glutamine-hydrolysing)